MLRGVWGAALYDLDPEAYQVVFQGKSGTRRDNPGYIIRPTAPDPEDNPAVDFILLGDAIAHHRSLFRAWDIASGMGLGKERRRFHFRFIRPYDSAGRLMPQSLDPRVWTLDSAAWPLEGDRESTPCRLWFPAPLRLLESDALIESPRLPDIVAGILRRIRGHAPYETFNAFNEYRPALDTLARTVAFSPWQGRRVDFWRYSGRQKNEITLRGVAGHIDLPNGPGPLWPFFAAAQWLHIGKGATCGLGQVCIFPLDED